MEEAKTRRRDDKINQRNGDIKSMKKERRATKETKETQKNKTARKKAMSENWAKTGATNREIKAKKGERTTKERLAEIRRKNVITE